MTLNGGKLLVRSETVDSSCDLYDDLAYIIIIAYLDPSGAAILLAN